MSVFERVNKVLEDSLGIDADDITIDANLVEDLGADSLDLVEIIMGIEEEFHIDITDSQAEKIKTVQDIVTFITLNR